MAFRLIDEGATFRVPVTVRMPSAGGAPAEGVFHCDFRWRDERRTAELSREGDLALLREVVAGWEGVQAHDGTPLEFSEANLELCVRIGYWKLAVINAWSRWCMGLAEKNSAPPPRTGEPAAGAS